MKNLLFILLVFNINSLFSQIVLGQDSAFEEHNINEEDVVAHNTHAVSVANTEFAWKLHSVDVPSTWVNDAFICDYVTCWDSAKNNNSYTLPNSKDYPLDVHFLNEGNAGEGNAKLLVWEVADSLNTFKFVTYKVRVAEGVKIQEVNKLSLRTFPNPVLNNLTIENINTKEITKIELYNIIGKRVLSIENPNEKEILNLSTFNNGVYILKLTDKNSNNFIQNILKK